MTNPNSGTENKTQNQSHFFRHILNSAAATVFSYPIRRCMNQAGTTQSPLIAIRNCRHNFFDAFFLNLARGTMATGSQAFSKQETEEFFRKRENLKSFGFVAGVGASTIAGAVIGSIFETAFIRKDLAKGALISLMRYNCPLFTMYLIREAGFSLSVVASSEMPRSKQNMILVGMTPFIAWAQKAIVTESGRDLLPAGKTVPNFEEGVFSTFRSMARGDKYTHEAYQVLFKNTTNPLKLMANFMHVACGANMLLWRWIYLVTFREILQCAAAAKPSLSEGFGFFSKPQERVCEAPSQLQEEIQDQAIRS